MKFAKERELLYLETSAKEATNVAQAFDELLQGTHADARL